MREVELEAVLTDSRYPILLLRDKASAKAVPVWIGEAEAMSIRLAQTGQQFPRPLTHDLMCTLLEAAGANLEKVVIAKIVDGTYYATLYLRTKASELKEVDARPSDSVALALRTGSPIYIEEEVFAAMADEFDPVVAIFQEALNQAVEQCPHVNLDLLRGLWGEAIRARFSGLH